MKKFQPKQKNKKTKKNRTKKEQTQMSAPFKGYNKNDLLFNDIQYDETIENIEGYGIFMRKWKPKDSKGILIFIHGYGMHSGRYINLARYFIIKHYSVVFYDLAGHGLSSGKPKWYIDNIKTHVAIANKIIDEVVESNEEKLPIFLAGHSMGGLITSIIEQQRNDIKGYIDIAPAFKIKNFLLAYLFWFCYILCFFFGKWTIGGVSSESVYLDDGHGLAKKKAEENDSDPLVIGPYTNLNTSVQIEYYGRDMIKKEVKQPMLIIHGTEDTLIDIHASEEVASHFKNEKSKMVKVHGNHMLFADCDDDVCDAMSTWIKSLQE